MNTLERQLNLAIPLIISCVLIGALGIQMLTEATPCSLCLLQRLGMIGVAIAAFLNIFFGSRSSHYGLMLLSAVVGGAVATRHILLHVCSQHSDERIVVFGLHLFTWSFIIFPCVVVFVSIMLFLREETQYRTNHPQTTQPSRTQSYLFALVFVIITMNIVTTGCQCGIGFCNPSTEFCECST